MGRSLAVYLGAAVVIFAYLGLFADSGGTKSEELDRAWLESPALPALHEFDPEQKPSLSEPPASRPR